MTMMRVCEVIERGERCGRRVIAVDMCETHYRRVRRGRPLVTPVWTWDDLTAALRTTVADAAMGAPDACWIWTGMLNSTGKYGLIGTKLGGKERHFLTHRLMYGDIPDGLQLDHLCKVTLCCNPDHLEPVTARENSQRYAATITHCPRGHEYSPENTSVRNRKRICLTCRADEKWLKRNPGGSLDDARRRGRNRKWTDDEIALIRASDETKFLAEHFGVSKNTIRRIRSGHR